MSTKTVEYFAAIAHGLDLNVTPKSAARASAVSARIFTRVRNEHIARLIAKAVKAVAK